MTYATKRTLTCLTVLTGTFYACIAAAAPPTPKTEFGTFGLDESGMDRSVSPGDDFYRYANGSWQARTVIPPDRSWYGVPTIDYETALSQAHTILEEADVHPAQAQMGALYASFMDEKAIEARGIEPIASRLRAIASATNKAELARRMAELQRQGGSGLFDIDIAADAREPTKYVTSLIQSGLGMPDRSYYLDPDAHAVGIRQAYLDYLTRLLVLAGKKDAVQRAKQVLAFETLLARSHWTPVEMRDANKRYNPSDGTALERTAAGLSWPLYLQSLGLTNKRLIVWQPAAAEGEASAWAQTPIPVLRDWLTVRTIDAFAPYLSSTIVTAHFHFHGQLLSGTPSLAPRWKRGVRLVQEELPDAIGKAYVDQHFSPVAKAGVEDIAHHVVSAFRARLAHAEWLAAATRTKAMAKLDSIQIVLSYPDTWQDYSRIVVDHADLLGNVARINAAAYARNLAKLGQRVDRREFPYSASQMMAWATPNLLEIGFSAAFLQAPFFDPHADPAINYGAIGAVIGHELSHHFDDQGRKSDQNGALAEWWTPEDVAHFNRITQSLVEQYDAYEPLAGVHINGRLTLGENLADLAGLAVSYQAYKDSLLGRPAPVLNGLTGDQRFFLGHAQTLREKDRDDELRKDLVTDPHSPGEQRALEVRNLNSWYAAFNVRPGDALYLSPSKRVRIW